MSEKKADKETEDPKSKADSSKDGKGESNEGEAGAEGAVDESQLKKKKKKKIIIIAAVAAVLVIGGAVGGLFAAGVIGKHKDQTAESAEAAGDGADKTHAVKADPVYFNLGDLIINLSTEGNRRLFLKMKISLEVSKPEEAAAIEKLKPRIVDQFQIYLRELRMDDFRGSAGMDKLREELMLRTNAVVKPIKVRDVLFQEILVSQ